MKKYIKYGMVMIASIMMFVSCNKENADLQVLMTDGVGDFEKINIDLQGVFVKFDKDTNSWVEMLANKGVYNLLDFQNGVTTIISNNTNLPQNTVTEMRLVLGANNSVVEKGQTAQLPLILSSQDESGLKIKINKKLQKNLNSITIDFDAGQSVVKESGSGYKLKPVIKLK